MRYLRILLGICLLVTLAGCLGALSPDDTTPTAEPTPLPTATPGQTPTATSTPTPTATATPEPTPLPTPTPTQTPTPTATPTPEPQNKVGTINEWVETRHNGTRMRIKMADYFTTDEIEKSDGGTRSPDEGNTYLVAEVFALFVLLKRLNSSLKIVSLNNVAWHFIKPVLDGGVVPSGSGDNRVLTVSPIGVILGF